MLYITIASLQTDISWNVWLQSSNQSTSYYQ